MNDNILYQYPNMVQYYYLNVYNPLMTKSLHEDQIPIHDYTLAIIELETNEHLLVFPLNQVIKDVFSINNEEHNTKLE